MYTYYFEKLEAWKVARELTKQAYTITSSNPNFENYGLSNQIRRAAVSVSANLAEGNSRTTKKDQAHFTTISYSSLMELLNLLILSLDLEYINQEQYEELRKVINRESILLIGLRKSQMNKTHSL